MARLLPLLLLACSVRHGDVALPDVDDTGEADPVGPDTDVTDPGGGDTGDVPVEVDEACYLGAARDGATCLPVVVPESLPDAYDYPPPYGGDPNYREPIAYLDLQAIDGTTRLAPNFRLDELALPAKGRWGVVQPGLLDHLQALRDELGPLIVNSGYRSPAYNAGVGGVSSSRHQYGDAADLDPVSATLGQLADACERENAAYVGVYEAHIHCDWRDDPVDEAFMGPASSAFAPAPPPRHEAWLVADGDGFVAPATGFDEGEPLRLWWAWDASGAVVGHAVGRRFVPPAGAAHVGVEVGRQVWVER